MSISHSPSGSAGSKKTILQKLSGKIKGAIVALGIISSPAIAQTSSHKNVEPKIPTIEERLAIAQKMNLEGIKSYQELENTIEFTWSQLKNTPNAPKEIRDKYGHITTEGLTWLESELPAEYLRRAQKYKNMERELEKMDKKDPNYGAWEYSLMCLGALMIGIVGYKIGKVSKKELEKLENESRIAHEEATKHMQERAIAEGKNAELEAKIAAMKKAQKMGGRAGKIVDAEFVETRSSDETLPSPEIPEWIKDTFLAEDTYQEIRNLFVSDLSSDTIPKEATELQESIQQLSDTTGTIHIQAGRLSTMSEKFILYARHKNIPEDSLRTLLRGLEKSFSGKEFSFKRTPVIGESFDTYSMVREGDTKAIQLKVTRVLSLAVEHEHKTISKAKVNC